MKTDMYQFLKICLLTTGMCSSYPTYSQLIAEGDEAKKLFDEYYLPLANSGGEIAEWGGAYDTTYQKIESATRVELTFDLDGFPAVVHGLFNTKGDTLKPVLNSVESWDKDQYVVSKSNYVPYVITLFILNVDFKAFEIYRSQPNKKSIVIRRNGKWGIIDSDDFSVLTECVYEEMENRVASYTVRDSAGKWQGYTNAVAVAKKGVWGLISAKNEVLMDFEFTKFTTDLGHFVYDGGYLGQKVDGWRYYNANGIQQLPEVYDSIYVVEGDKAFVMKNGHWAYTYKDDYWDTDDHAQKWNRTEYVFDELIFADRCLVAKRDGGNKWGLIWADETAEVVADYEYDEVFLNEKMWFIPLKKNGKWAFFKGSEKKFTSDFIYDEIIEVRGYFATVKLNGAIKEIDL